jgi:hypothetical protein
LLVAGVSVASLPAAAALPAAGPATPLDTCTLLPDSEVAAIVGYAVNPGEAVVSTPTMSGCAYDATDAAAGADVGVLLTTAAARNKKPFSDKVLAAYGKATKVPDLGKKARFAYKKGRRVNLAALRVVEGTDGVIATLKGPVTKADARTMTEALATAALGKISSASA